MNELQRNEVVRLYYSGVSKRAIARQLGIARNTVTAVLATHQVQRAEGQRPPELEARSHRKSLLDEYADRIREWLTTYPNMTAVRVLEELKKLGFDGKYSIVKEHVAALRPRPAQPIVERFETAPGHQWQMDYSPYTIPFTQEGRRDVDGFSMVCGYCRKQYLRFVEAQDFFTTIQQHVKAFEHFGGVPRVILYDNFKGVVDRIEDGEPIYNARFLAFATHFGFRPVACRRRRPQTKGKVERPFLYIETNLLNGRDFATLAHLNEIAASWLSDVADVRIHRETKRRPVDMHQDEIAHLLPLPAGAYDTAEIVYRIVDDEGFIAFRANRYSVPWQRIGSTVVVRATETLLIVYAQDILEIARHELLSRTVTRQRVVDPAHRPRHDRQQQEALLAERFDVIGEVGTRFLAGLLQSHAYGKHQACRTLALFGSYRRQDVIAAIDRAVRYRSFSVTTLERILSATAEPKPALETMTEQVRDQIDDRLRDPAVPPRSAQEYQQLIAGHEPEQPTEVDEAGHGTA